MQKEKSATIYDLENMTIPELEELLQKDFTASDINQPDVDFMMEVTKVILQKEKEQGTYTPVDIDKAWADFQEYYVDPKVKSVKVTSSKRRISRMVLIAAVVAILIAMSTIPVMGYKNVFHMIGTWTAEQFYFTTEGVADESMTPFSVTEQTDLSCEFSTIYDALAVYGISNIALPREMPAGYVQTEFSVTEAVSGRIRFFELYYRDDSFLALTVTRHADTQSSKYEKTTAELSMEEKNKISHRAKALRAMKEELAANV